MVLRPAPLTILSFAGLTPACTSTDVGWPSLRARGPALRCYEVRRTDRTARPLTSDIQQRWNLTYPSDPRLAPVVRPAGPARFARSGSPSWGSSPLRSRALQSRLWVGLRCAAASPRCPPDHLCRLRATSVVWGLWVQYTLFTQCQGHSASFFDRVIFLQSLRPAFALGPDPHLGFKGLSPPSPASVTLPPAARREDDSGGPESPGPEHLGPAGDWPPSA